MKMEKGKIYLIEDTSTDLCIEQNKGVTNTFIDIIDLVGKCISFIEKNLEDISSESIKSFIIETIKSLSSDSGIDEENFTDILMAVCFSYMLNCHKNHKNIQDFNY